MKCPSCNQRKGKRTCPALRSEICTACCGSKQVREIACPAECTFLVEGREYREMRHYRRQLQGPDAEIFEKVLLELTPPLRNLQHVLVQMHRVFRGFDDSSALEAVQKVVETCETESRGVIFEQRSSDPQVQAAIQELMQEIDELRKMRADSPEMKPVRLADVILCLKFLEKDIVAMQQDSAGSAAYLEFLVSSFPEEKRPSSGLIIPG
jgi:hypothetical protein